MRDRLHLEKVHEDRARKLRPVLDALLALPLPQHVDVGRDEATVFTIGFGWYMRVRRTAIAVRVLSDAGLDHEAAPLVRSMIEHAVGLLWLEDARDTVVTVLRRMHKEWAGKVKAALAGTTGWSVDPSVFDVFLAADIPNTDQDHLAAFRHRCERYSQLDLYVAWLSETQESHPTLSTANAYVEGASVETATLHEVPATTSAISRATPLLLIATEVMDSLMPDRLWQAEVDKLREQFQAAFSIDA